MHRVLGPGLGRLLQHARWRPGCSSSRSPSRRAGGTSRPARPRWRCSPASSSRGGAPTRTCAACSRPWPSPAWPACTCRSWSAPPWPGPPPPRSCPALYCFCGGGGLGQRDDRRRRLAALAARGGGRRRGRGGGRCLGPAPAPSTSATRRTTATRQRPASRDRGWRHGCSSCGRSSLTNGNSSGRYFDRFSRAFFTYSLVTPSWAARSSVAFHSVLGHVLDRGDVAAGWRPCTGSRPRRTGWGRPGRPSCPAALMSAGGVVRRLDQLLGELVEDVAPAQERGQGPGGVLVVPDPLVLLLQHLGLGDEALSMVALALGPEVELERLGLEGVELLLDQQELGLGRGGRRRAGRAAARGCGTRRAPSGRPCWWRSCRRPARPAAPASGRTRPRSRRPRAGCRSACSGRSGTAAAWRCRSSSRRRCRRRRRPGPSPCGLSATASE